MRTIVLKSPPLYGFEDGTVSAGNFQYLRSHAILGPAAVNGDIDAALFGQVMSAAAPRILQLGAKFYF